MGSTMRIAHRLRLAAILALGAFALHQLRYLIAFGSSSSAQLAHQGHGYLAGVLPILCVFAVSALLATLVRGRRGAALRGASAPRRIGTFALLLLAIYATQESIEGMLAAGHPDGVAALLSHRGWLALPLAAVLGAASALAARLLEQVEVAIGAGRVRRKRLQRAPRVRGRARSPFADSLISAPLAFGLARRPPPFLSA